MTDNDTDTNTGLHEHLEPGDEEAALMTMLAAADRLIHRGERLIREGEKQRHEIMVQLRRFCS